MNSLKEVLKHEVFPALGCTEPIAVAYAASIAAEELEGEIADISIKVDPGVYKNGFAVTLPNTNGEKGNLIAGVLGALIKKPELSIVNFSESPVIEPPLQLKVELCGRPDNEVAQDIAKRLQDEIQRVLRFKTEVTTFAEGELVMEYGATGKVKLVEKAY